MKIHYDMRCQQIVGKEEDGTTKYDNESSHESDQGEHSSSDCEMITSIIKEVSYPWAKSEDGF